MKINDPNNIFYESIIKHKDKNEKIIALAGNPNVGKSTVFNALTGLNQHTGNWPGKTVTNACGSFKFNEKTYILVDLPGSYSLMAHSAEEEVARDFICFGEADMIVVVCDATCIERNLNLVLQILEITNNVIVCINLMDEAKKKGIKIDINTLSEKLGVQVIVTEARKKKGLDKLVSSISSFERNRGTVKIHYADYIETALDELTQKIDPYFDKFINTRWIALKLLENDPIIIEKLTTLFPQLGNDEITHVIKKFHHSFDESEISKQKLSDDIAKAYIFYAESICSDIITYKKQTYNERDRRIDKILTGKYTGLPVMLCLIGLIFWITIIGANYPSQMLNKLMFEIEDILLRFFIGISAPKWLYSMIVFGIFRVLGWVISVMLPPMAIFFPLFTLLEDLGYLPRMAFNLDNCFKKCNTCGKQALTMSMGFGCNAVGVTGCRIIDSPRERIIAIITNSFVPCNGRFPTLIAIITIFFTFSTSINFHTLWSAFILLILILIGISITFLISKLLSLTILKGKPSSFTLELPPYRVPLVGSVIVRSILDRTIFVLGRAAAVAAPAGLLIWILANVNINDITILNYTASFLDPFGKFIGLDGVILLGFILGFPANEIVLPLIIMMYMSNGILSDIGDLNQLKTILIDNGWTATTAACMLIFSLFHWPCSTTLITIKKETQSLLWTVTAFVLPTIIGVILCALISNISRLF